MIGRRDTKSPSRSASSRRPGALPVIAAVLLPCGVAGYLLGGLMDGRMAPSLHAARDCRIKGNVGFATGERIYHVPGQADYDRTKVSPGYGERWFCSEAEARRSGWRRAAN